MKLSQNRALIEAKRRWGKTAMIRHRPVKPGYPLLPYRVGYIALGMFFHVEGHGNSWEEAFADADKK